MGIRIAKSIGYWISKKSAKLILTPDYKIILEKLDYDDNTVNEFWENFSVEMKKNCRIDFFSQEYLESKQEPYKFLSEFVYKDKEDGLFLCTLEQFKSKRYNDLIDYYENNKNCKSSIKHLYSCLSPISKYRFSSRIKIGGFDTSKYYDGQTIVSTYNTIFSTELTLEDLIKKESVFPEIEPEIYCFAKAANILNEIVSKEKFDEMCKPVIVTDWH